MKAIVCHRYGSPDVPPLEDIDSRSCQTMACWYACTRLP